jgi:hypothetical protein
LSSVAKGGNAQGTLNTPCQNVEPHNPQNQICRRATAHGNGGLTANLRRCVPTLHAHGWKLRLSLDRASTACDGRNIWPSGDEAIMAEPSCIPHTRRLLYRCCNVVVMGRMQGMQGMQGCRRDRDGLFSLRNPMLLHSRIALYGPRECESPGWASRIRFRVVGGRGLSAGRWCNSVVGRALG